MDYDDDLGEKSPEGSTLRTLETWRTDWKNIAERQRARIRREAGGASRDIITPGRSVEGTR